MSFSSWSHLSRRRSTLGWQRGAWMGNHGLRAGLPSTKTVPSRPRKIGSCSSWSTSKPIPCRWCTGVYSAWSRAKPIKWIHVLLPALLAALRALGDAPARSLTALAQRLGVSEAEAATVVAAVEDEPPPVLTVPAAAPVSPLLCELARKKENPSLDGAMHRLLPFALPPVPRMRMPHQQSHAARLNDLLFEVVTRVAPHVAYPYNATYKVSREGAFSYARDKPGADAVACLPR